MHAKGIKKLTAAWKDVRKKGGHFLIALNGFPQNKVAVPTLVANVAEKVDKAALRLAADDVKIDKLISGRVVIEDGKIAFVIDEDSMVKSPAVLKQAVRQLSKQAGLEDLLEKAANGLFRMDAGLDLDGEADLDSKGQAQAAGGKASKLAKFVRSDWTKILDGLDRWNKSFGGRLDGTTVAKAEASLIQLEARAKSWLSKHADDARKGERKVEVEHVLASITAAKRRIAAYRDAVRRDEASDTLLDALAAGNASKDPGVLGPQLRSAEDNLGARLAKTTDADEKAALAAQLKVLEAAITRNLGDRAKALAEREKTDAPNVEERNARLEEGLSLGREVVPRAQEVLRRFLDGEVESTAGNKEATLILGALEEIGRAGQKKVSNQVREQLLESASSEVLDGMLEKASGATTTATRRAFLGTLGRENNAMIALRARTIDSIGRDYSDEMSERLKASLGPMAMRSPAHVDKATHPKLAAARDEANNASIARDEWTLKAREVIRARLIKRFEAFGPDNGRAIVTLDAFLRSPELGEDHPMPTLEEAVGAHLQRNPGLVEGYIDTIMPQVKEYLSHEGLYDNSPEKTLRVFRELAVERAGLGLPVDVASLMRAIPDQDHWMNPLPRGRIDDKVQDQGIVSPEDTQAETVARQHFDESRRINRDVLPQKVAEFGDADPALFQALEKGFRDLVDPMLREPAKIPRPIRAAALDAFDRLSVIPEVGTEAGYTIASDMLFLRWLAPQFGNAVGARANVLIGGLFMNAANETVPSKTEALPFIPLVREYTPKFRKFLDDVLEVTRQESGPKSVGISDTVTRTVNDPITGKAVTGQVEQTEHPDRRTGLSDKEQEKRVLEKRGEAINEAIKNPTPEGIWATFFVDQAAGVIGSFAKGVKDEMRLIKENRKEFLRPLRPFFLERCKDTPNALVYANGSMPAVKVTLEKLRELLREDAEEVREGGEGRLFQSLDDEEEQLDVTDHWDVWMGPRIVGVLNNLLAKGERQNVRPVNPSALARCPVLADAWALHGRVYDAKKHQRIPTQRENMEPEIRSVFELAEKLLTEAIDAVVRSKQSTDVFAWDPI